MNQPELVTVLRRRPDLHAVLDVTHPEPPQAERVRTAATERAPSAVRARVLKREVIVEVIAPDGTHPT